MRFQAVNRCLMASVWWASDFRLSTLGLILGSEAGRVSLDSYIATNRVSLPEWNGLGLF